MKSKGWLFTVITVILATLIPTLASCDSSPGVFEQILSVIPNTTSNRAVVAINDYSQMRKQLQIDPLREEATIDEQKAYISALLSMDGLGKNLRLAANIGFVNNNVAYLEQSIKAMQNMAIGYWAVEQEVSAGWPPINVSIVKGRFNPERSRQALAESAKDNPPSIEIYDENTIYSWGGDNEINLDKMLTPPAYDMLGRGGRFVFQDEYAFRTNATSPLKQVLDAQKDVQKSVANIPEFCLIAKELDSHGAMSAHLSDQTQSLALVRNVLTASGDITVEDVDNYLKQGPILLPYQTLGMGISKDEKGLYALIILVHVNEQTAAQNVDLLQQRIQQTSSFLTSKKWSSIFSNVSVSSKGRVLTAKLYGPDVGRDWLDWYFKGEPLVVFK